MGTENGRLVLVAWRDSLGVGGWEPRAEALQREPATCESVGWILFWDSKRMILHADRDTGVDSIGRTIIIPGECIASLTELGGQQDG